MRILAVDDEPLFLEVLEQALRDIGFPDVTPIYSASEVLRELKTGKRNFDCILLDIRMPGMNGVELCRKIREVPGYKRTPIMMVTAMTERGFMDEAFSAGASDYLTKPLDPLELKVRMSMIERLITEQSRNILLEQSSAMQDRSDDDDDDDDVPEFEFEAVLHLPGLDRLQEYSSVDNYLARLSAKDSFSTSVFGIAVSNAAEFYASASRVDFINMLHDVGVVLEAALKRQEALITYAGKGVFVVVTIGTNVLDMQMLEHSIQQRLANYSQIYVRDKLPIPSIRVGTEMRRTLFSHSKVTDLMRSAENVASGATLSPPVPAVAKLA